MLQKKAVTLASGSVVTLREWSFDVLDKQSELLSRFLEYVRALMAGEIRDGSDLRLRAAWQIIDFSLEDPKEKSEVAFADAGDLLIEIYELNRVGDTLKKFMALDLLHGENQREALELRLSQTQQQMH